MSIRIGILILVLAMAGCRGHFRKPKETAPPPKAPTPIGREMFRTEMIFGMTQENGDPVTEVQWQKFVDDAIAVWFPGGFTIVDGLGRWRNAEGKVVDERSKILVIFHDGDVKMFKALDELGFMYRARFGKQAVIRATGQTWVTF